MLFLLPQQTLCSTQSRPLYPACLHGSQAAWTLTVTIAVQGIPSWKQTAIVSTALEVGWGGCLSHTCAPPVWLRYMNFPWVC